MILVTGGTGLLGSHLLSHLTENGESVRALYRPGADIEMVQKVFGYYQNQNFDKVEWFSADLFDVSSLEYAFEGVTEIYHCAAIISFSHSEKKMMIRNNIDITSNIVNLAIEKKIRKFCHVSSVSALGKREDNEPLSENDLWRPSPNKSGYSISKYYSEMEVWRGFSEGLNGIIVNPSVILGPGNINRGSTKFFSGIRNGLKYYTAGMTGFVDVRDVCRCMIALMESDISGERFILNSENIFYKEIFRAIADALGVKAPDRSASRFMLEAGWRLDWVRSKLTFSKPILTRETAKSGMSVTRYSNKKITDAIGFKFTSVVDTVGWTASKLQ